MEQAKSYIARSPPPPRKAGVGVGGVRAILLAEYRPHRNAVIYPSPAPPLQGGEHSRDSAGLLVFRADRTKRIARATN